MDRNQYIKIEKSVEEISKIKINFYMDYNDNERIEDLALEGDENVIIYNNTRGNGDEFINIYSKTRIMITTEYSINKDRYKKLPENVEYVIVDNEVYEVKDEFTMIKIMTNEKIIEYIGELERQGRINENNKKGETALYGACYKYMERVAMELIPKMSGEAINKWDKDGRTALMIACQKRMERVAMELIPRMSEEAINKWDKDGRTALYWACYKKMERVAMELTLRMSEEAINKWNIDGVTALYCACYHKMENVAMELIPRMSEEAINKWYEDGYTALYWACYNKMERVAMELIPKMSKGAINKERIDYKNLNNRSVLFRAEVLNEMEEVEEMIKERIFWEK